MGQENTRPQIQHKFASNPRSSHLTTARKSRLTSSKLNQRIQCQGLLKLHTTPFKNSIQIQTQTQILFLENIQTTLKLLLQTRLHTNKLFLGDDIQKLIQAVTFTLAYLQEKGVIYKDINSENIYYDNGTFKLLPNQLIESNTYQRLKLEQNVHPSPELIIAMRCCEQDITDEDILEKSNVFTLGMTLLQATSLLSSSDCYDSQNYDILDSVINERIVLVQQYYGQKIARIIANMLDYDYTQRMNMKELSIWINRQLQPARIIDNQPENLLLASMTSSKAEKQSDVKPLQTQTTSILTAQKKGRLIKNNSVYMNRDTDNQKQDRNKIYINDHYISDEIPTKNSNVDFNRYYPNRRPQSILQKVPRGFDKMVLHNGFNQDSFKFLQSQKQQLRHPNPYCQDFKFPKRQEHSDKNIEKESTKRISKQPVNPYRNYFPQNNRQIQPQQPNKKEKHPLKEIGNHQYYPNIEDILKTKNPQSNIDIKGPICENGALNRIKQQIMKSRKLIEQFKRSEGLKF